MHRYDRTALRGKASAPPGYRPDVVDPSFRIVQDLAAELSTGKISFPTFIDATLKIRRALNDPNADADRIARTISAEPLLAAKLVQVANSAALGAPGQPVTEVKAALLRIGYANVHSIATSVAMAQLVVAKEMQPFLRRAEAVWRHSIDVAAIGYMVAAKLTKLNPDEALFAGLVHDIGSFYLLSKAPKYPELCADVAALEALIDEWHPSIGHAVLAKFSLSEAALKAVMEHESKTYPSALKTLTDVIAVANLLSKEPNPLNGRASTWRTAVSIEHPTIVDLLEASTQELTSLVAGLRV